MHNWETFVVEFDGGTWNQFLKPDFEVPFWIIDNQILSDPTITSSHYKEDFKVFPDNLITHIFLNYLRQMRALASLISRIKKVNRRIMPKSENIQSKHLQLQEALDNLQ